MPWCSQHAICVDLPTCWKPTRSFYPGDSLADVSSLVYQPVLYRCRMPHFTEKRACGFVAEACRFGKLPSHALSLIARTLSSLSVAHLPMLVGGRFLVLCLLSAALDIHLSAYGCWCKPEISAEVSFLQRPHLLRRCTGCQLGVQNDSTMCANFSSN